MIIANFTAIYLPTLSTIGTALALGTVYSARKEREEEKIVKWIESHRTVTVSLADAVVELAEAARADYIEKFKQNPQAEPSREGASPPSMRIPRMKLKAAIASASLWEGDLPRCKALVVASQAAVIRDADAALDEVADTLSGLTGWAKRRFREQFRIPRWKRPWIRVKDWWNFRLFVRQRRKQDHEDPET